jgi:hypothetical protein
MTSAADVPQIDSDPCPVTVINVFEIDSDKLDLFFAEWRKRAEFMAKHPGFRSVKLHRALTPDARFQLVNIAQWDMWRRAVRGHSATVLPTERAPLDAGGRSDLSSCLYRVALEVTAPELSEQETLND